MNVKDSEIEEKRITELYSTDGYISKNPSLHEEDSPWKIDKIIPLVDEMFNLGHMNKKEISLLDVGGGVGLILKEVSSYIERTYGVHVNKYALDLSPGMLKIQVKNNPDAKALNEDIRETSLSNKEIDLVLMIDVLEHVPNPIKALEELKRISKIAIFKVPLESNVLSNTIDIITHGKSRENAIESVGHINIYNFNSLKHQIENNGSRILNSYFTNVFDYVLASNHYAPKMSNKGKALNYVASYMFKISPSLCSCLFCDFAMILVRF